MAHSDRSLLDHLLGTRRLLEEWGCRAAVCDAGLFHSVYGTEHYGPAAVPFAIRERVCELIGVEAERLVWLFCVLDRDSFDRKLGRADGYHILDRRAGTTVPITRGEFDDLLTLSFANTLEAMPRLPWGQRRACRRYLEQFREVAIPPAQAALAAAQGRRWAFWR